MGRKLYVGNLAFSVTNDDLQAAFAEVGPCASVSVITDRATGQSRGFGFVEMQNEEDAQRAIQELDGRAIGGRPIKVSEAREREGGGGGGGGRGGRGGGGGGFGGRGGGGGGGGRGGGGGGGGWNRR
jgi:RNA recognition motif-containing protein